MVRLCCIPICPNSKAIRGEVACFPFPQDDKLRQQWIDFVGTGDPARFRWKTKFICSEHFLELELMEVNGQKQLLEGAVPMVYSPDDDDGDELVERNDLMVSGEPSVTLSKKNNTSTVTNDGSSGTVLQIAVGQLHALFCRICLKKTADLIPLNSKLRNDNLVDMIQAVSGLTIDSGGGLPTKICSTCVGKIDTAYKIRIEFIQHDLMLQNLIDTDQLQIYFEYHATRPSQAVHEKAAVHRSSFVNTVKPLKVVTTPVVVRRTKVAVAPVQNLVTVETVDLSLIEPSSIKTEQADKEPEMHQDVDNEHLMGDDDDFTDDQTETSKAKHSNKEGENSKTVETPKQVFSWKDLCKQKTRVCKPAVVYKITEVLPRPTLVPHTCYICDTANEDANALETHLEQHVDQLPYKCDQCSTEQVPQVFRTLISLNRHLQTHLYPYTCDYCPLQFQYLQSYHRHMEEMHLAHKSEGFTCDFCGQFFVRKRLFQMHWHKHKAMEEGKYKCEFCAKAFGTGSLLRRHVRTHTGETPYECKKCGKRFNHLDNFKNHKRLHIGEKGYICEECGSSFLNSTFLRVHMLKHFPNDPRYRMRSKRPGGVEREYVCDYEDCKFVTKKYQTFHHHRAYHLRRFVCEVCGKNFPMKCNLVRHKSLVHEGKVPEYRLKCPYCAKGFNCKQKLGKHVDVHENNRRHKCQFCEKAFVDKENCRAHERIHTGERPYLCRMCPSAFITSSGRKKHEATHNRAEQLVQGNE